MTLSTWTDLITGAHQDKPKYMASIAETIQPLSDMIDLLNEIPSLFDLDTAVGAQLDVCGLWLGLSRYIPVTLTNIWFSWNTSNLGWGQGLWKGPYATGNTTMTLDDATYRTMLKGKVAANKWDGTLVGAYGVWNAAFGSRGITLAIARTGVLQVSFTITGPVSVIDKALIQGGYFDIVPAGVKVTGYVFS